MASHKIPPSLSHPQTAITCAHCLQPTAISKRITADRKIYCRKLCAVLGLIRDTHDEDGIDQDTGVDALKQMVEDSFLEGPVRIPTKVRERDTEAALDLLLGPLRLSDRIAMVVIDDEGTPDWIPELPSVQEPLPKNEVEAGPSQAEIDRIVEDLLSSGDDTEGRQ
jgi:hypothetical protein